jgi:hypothetical protein
MAEFHVQMDFSDERNPDGEWTVRVVDFENGDAGQSVYTTWDAAVEFARWWMDK